MSLNPDVINTLSEVQTGIYPLPDKEIDVKVFKGAKFNINELALQFTKSSSLKTLFEKSKIDELQRNPLLPLKVSQIGLIGGSGLMNGLIECDTPHVIKGRIVKERKAETITDKKGIVTEIREVTSNRMIFNILTPYGIKRLA